MNLSDYLAGSLRDVRADKVQRSPFQEFRTSTAAPFQRPIGSRFFTWSALANTSLSGVRSSPSSCDRGSYGIVRLFVNSRTRHEPAIKPVARIAARASLCRYGRCARMPGSLALPGRRRRAPCPLGLGRAADLGPLRRGSERMRTLLTVARPGVAGRGSGQKRARAYSAQGIRPHVRSQGPALRTETAQERAERPE